MILNNVETRTQFNISIRILRGDNVKEYLSIPFSSFMSSYGSFHQSSPANTDELKSHPFLVHFSDSFYSKKD